MHTLCLTVTALVASALAAHAVIDGANIEQITGLKGTFNEAEGVFKVSAPRNDVKVTVEDWPMSGWRQLAHFLAMQ